MRTKPLSRRTALRGLLTTGTAVSIGLPLLEIMLNDNGTALAQSGEPLPPLFVTWFFGNGTLPGRWKPAATGTGSAWQLSAQLAPLADFKADMTVISGLEGKLVMSGFEHPTGSAAATTAAPLNGVAVRAPSIDQVVAEAIAGNARFHSIEVGVTPATPGGPQDSLHTVSHNGPNSRNNPEFDPKALFTRLFGGFEPAVDEEAEQAAKMVAVRRSVLDSVLAGGAKLQERLGAADRQRVEDHLDAIRAIEKRLTAPEPTLSECAEISSPDIGPDTKSEAPPGVNSAMAELTALALACNQTRVATFMFSLPAAHVYYRHLAANMNDDFHDTICHGDAGDPSNQPRVDTGVIYTMQCLAELLGHMKSTPYGAGTLLDSSLVYVTSDTAWGKVHDAKEWPVLLLGKAGGRLRGDEHHNFQGENLSRALLTVAQLMDPTVTEIGVDGGHTSAALPGIIV